MLRRVYVHLCNEQLMTESELASLQNELQKYAVIKQPLLHEYISREEELEKHKAALQMN